MVHASVTYLTTIARVGCGLRKRKSEELIGTVEVKTKNKMVTGKIEEKKNKVWPDAFSSLHSVQSSYLEGARAHEVPASTAQEIIRFYLHLTGPIILKRNLRELPFEGYQTGSLSHCGWEGIPETYSIWEKAAFMIFTGSWDLPVL